MSSTLALVLLILSLLLIPLLLWVIRRQWLELRREQSADRSKRAEQDAGRRRIKASVEILARSILAEQVDYSEACIRIKVLLDAIAPDLCEQPPFDVFQLVYTELELHPTHEARQQISREQRRRLDKERWSLEETHSEAIREAADALLRHPVLA